MAYSVYCFLFPLELSNSVLSGSSSIGPTSCARFCSSLTITGFFLYYGVWISLTSTTTGVSFSLVSIKHTILHVFLLVLPSSPTCGSDISMRATLDIDVFSEFLVVLIFISLLLGSTFSHVKLTQCPMFPPFFHLYRGMIE
jgi:hypothetical protein